MTLRQSPHSVRNQGRKKGTTLIKRGNAGHENDVFTIKVRRGGGKRGESTHFQSGIYLVNFKSDLEGVRGSGERPQRRCATKGRETLRGREKGTRDSLFYINDVSAERGMSTH